MATLRSDIIIPEVFTPYVIEQTTQRDAFLASGVVQPMAELNATEGGDFVNVPFWKANLSGDFEVLSDSASLTPGKITADKQIGVILHRGRAFEARDLAALAAGSDPMAAIGAKIADYIANQRQKDLLSCLGGIFGAVGSDNASASFVDLTIDGGGSSETALSPRHVAEARWNRGEFLITIDLILSVDSLTDGSTANAFGNVSVPTFMGLRVIVSDDVQQSGSSPNKKFAVYFFTEGAVAAGEQLALQTETDRDILAKSDAMSIDLHYCYHPVGAKWGVTTTNPTRAQLETIGNWSKVYETKNIGIVRATVTSNFD